MLLDPALGSASTSGAAGSRLPQNAASNRWLLALETAWMAAGHKAAAYGSAPAPESRSASVDFPVRDDPRSTQPEKAGPGRKNPLEISAPVATGEGHVSSNQVNFNSNRSTIAADRAGAAPDMTTGPVPSSPSILRAAGGPALLLPAARMDEAFFRGPPSSFPGAGGSVPSPGIQQPAMPPEPDTGNALPALHVSSPLTARASAIASREAANGADTASQETPEASAPGPAAEPEEFGPRHLHVQCAGGAVDVWLRDATITSLQAWSTASAIASGLRAQGLRLNDVVWNGQLIGKKTLPVRPAPFGQRPVYTSIHQRGE